MTVPQASGKVLSTLNVDGSRNWIRPKLSKGKWWRKRQIVAYSLMVLFFAIPHLKIRGKPAILLDVPHRQFTILGATFLPTDTLLLMLLLASALVGIFLFSALFGRVWCGWSCPQTIYMEFLFRPIERLVEGGRSGSIRIDRNGGWRHPRRLLKNLIYLGLALFLAHTFLAYFVGVSELSQWVRLSPLEHPTPFLVMAFTAALIFTDFAWFREQTCLIACPYGRWQASLLDRQSTIVAYDYLRGEPRAMGRIKPEGAGDCIDCGACVTTCPTGIDIRDGLQMECIHCTQCIDACDAIMEQVGRPTGLIRYASQDSLEGKPKQLLRPRVIFYPLAFAILFGGFLVSLATRSTADVTVLRSTATAFQMEMDGRVANQVRVKVANRTDMPQRYTITVDEIEGGELIAPENPLEVEGGAQRTTSIFVVLPATSFNGGLHRVTVRVSDGNNFQQNFPFTLLGPSGTEEKPQP